jgi:hypothetical protein
MPRGYIRPCCQEGVDRFYPAYRSTLNPRGELGLSIFLFLFLLNILDNYSEEI